MSTRPPAALSRRTAMRLVLGGAAGLPLVAGCDVEDLTSGSVDVPGTGRSDPAPDPDRELVDGVVGDVVALLAGVVEARQRFRPLRTPLRPLEDMHRAHLAALSTGGGSGGPSASSPSAGSPGPVGARGPAAARRADARLRAAESAHREALAVAALDAGSGTLAKLLAAMAASVGQHLGVPGAVPVTAADVLPVDPSTVEAWQSTLTGEQAAVYVWGVLGARTSDSATPTLFDAVRATYVEHRDRRDDLIGLVAATGAIPEPPAAAYVLPAGLETPAGVTAAAAALEERSAATYAALVGATSGAPRQLAISWLDMSAIRVLAFRGTPEMFPGAGEYADR